jgi:GNAT superfamily N-acetyltransferase
MVGRVADPVLRAVHHNFAATVGTMARHSGGTVLEAGGLLASASPASNPFPWNVSLRTDPDLSPPEFLDQARAFYGKLDKAFAVAALSGLDDDLIDHLGEATDISPEMVIDHSPLSLVGREGVEIRLVEDEAGRDHFLDTVGEAFETLGETAETWHLCYPTVESLHHPGAVAMVLYEREVPAAAGMYYRSGEVIEVIHIGTRPGQRRRGHGRAVAIALTRHGFGEGATLASLQSAPMGFRTYQRIGYRTIADYYWYLFPPG